MDWFERLTGFGEQGYAKTQSMLRVDGERMVSLANGRSFGIGRLEVVALAELRRRVAAVAPGTDVPRLRVANLVADVRRLHADPAFAGALFQVASQFNLLEMVSPDVTPEHGVTDYQHDLTQGPACAVACGAATLYRNYFVPVAGGVGQTRERQIDCLADLGTALGNEGGRLWTMRNGYALATSDGLQAIAQQLAQADPDAMDMLRGRLRVGVHADVEVTETRATGQRVTQVFCSALPVAYTRLPPSSWEPFARLVLEASYEATLAAAALNAARTGKATVLLTLVGGGAFGNDRRWIADALRRALLLYRTYPLDVRIVSHGGVAAEIERLVDEFD